MSDQSAAPERSEQAPAEPAQPTTEQQPAEPPAWLNPITDRMNELRDQNAQMAERLAALGGEGEPEEEPEGLSEDEMFDEYGDLTPEAAQQIIDQRVQDALSTHLAQQSAQDAVATRDELYDDLLDRVPELADEAERIVHELVADLRASGQEAVIDTPLFVDLIELRHKAEQFDKGAETDETAQQRVVLEAAGGASAQQRPKPQEDWGERIVKAAERLRPQI
jgi:DNA-binding ferritin-like protein